MTAVVRYPRPPELSQLGTRHAVVEASAGTGKTFLLEHLVVELLLNHGARIEEILVVTFTERATAELCLRLRKKLSELCHLQADHAAAAERPDQECWLIDETARGRLRDALLGLDRATISTIHGFCLGILGDHAFLHQRLFDEQAVDSDGAFHTAFVEALRNDFAVQSELQPYLRAWLVTGHTAAHLERALRECATELARIFPPRPEALQPDFDEAALAAAIAAWPAQAGRDPALAERLKKAGIKGSTAKAVLSRVAAISELAAEAGKTSEVATFLVQLQARESGWKERGFAYLLDHLAKTAADPKVAKLHEATAAIRDARVPFLAAAAHKFLPLVSARLQAHKRAAGLYDFQDMLTLVAERLADEGAPAQLLLSTLRRGYKYALIDEFQDTDDVQWFIFRRLFFESQEGHVLTVIGDPKQAIYRFRGADVHTYLRARGAILRAGGALVKLGKNFRSTAAVIDGYNAVFDPTMGFFRAGAGIDYDQPVACGHPGRRLCGASGQPEPGVVVLDVRPAGDETPVADTRRALRRQMVQEIRRLLSEDGARFVHDADGPKRIAARDIFVLAFTNNECDEIGETLRAAGLPFAFYKKDNLFQTAQAAEVLDLLRAIAEPEDHTLRARALLTAFFALDLADLANRDRPDNADPLLRQFLEWRDLALAGNSGTLFSAILGQSGIVCREVCLGRSERALTNYLHIFEILQEEAARAHVTFRELVETLGAYVNGTRLPPGNERNMQRLESDAEAVQVMTVHKAKGLEADVVFLYGGLHRGKFDPLSVFHDRDGRRVVQLGSLAPEEEEMHANEIADEDRRLLYVALTRARARLYLPRYPDGPHGFTGPSRFLRPILDKLLADTETSRLFHRVPVACPGEPLLPLPAPAPAALSAWQPPELPSGVAKAEFHRIAKERAGFVMTSYTGVKRRHGGFVLPEEPTDLSTANEPAEHAENPPVDPRELAHGRLSGIFLHAVLEKIPLDGLASSGSSAEWAAQPEIAKLLLRLAHRHEREPGQIAHAAHMVHTALVTPLRLGDCLVPGVGLARRSLRETEFLYPIPERHHPLLGLAATATCLPAGENAEGKGEDTERNCGVNGRAWSVERGLVKGFIDYLFEYQDRIYLCDWKGDWLPSWESDRLRAHCENNYEIQARLYALAVLRLAGLNDRAAFERRFGGVLYCFLRGMRPGDNEAGTYFRRPEWPTVLDWQTEMLGTKFWGLP
jgi:exodeoxyribonuclease V beta subunit